MAARLARRGRGAVVVMDRFRCDYCGQLADPDRAVVFWTQVDQMTDGTRMWLPAVYCSPYCGRTATSRVGSGRG